MGADAVAAALTTEAGAAGVPLTAPQVAAFLQYQRLIARWNTRARLTALTDPLQVVRVHFVDSLLCLRAPFPPAAAVIDVGSGAGFPGIPLAIARPDFQVTLLEANARKAAFLELAATELRLRCRVVHGRAETAADVPELREQFDVAVARAVAALPRLVAWTLPFVRVGGRAVLLKGPSVAAELSSAAEAIVALGGGPPTVIPAELSGGEKRSIVSIRKVTPTPGPPAARG